MGITYIKGKVSGPTGEAAAKFLVESGARYTLLPNAIWKEIGLQPKRNMRFVRLMARRWSETYRSATSDCRRAKATRQ